MAIGEPIRWFIHLSQWRRNDVIKTKKKENKLHGNGDERRVDSIYAKYYYGQVQILNRIIFYRLLLLLSHVSRVRFSFLSPICRSPFSRSLSPSLLFLCCYQLVFSSPHQGVEIRILQSHLFLYVRFAISEMPKMQATQREKKRRKSEQKEQKNRMSFAATTIENE